jgi:hypothetical protein
MPPIDGGMAPQFVIECDNGPPLPVYHVIKLLSQIICLITCWKRLGPLPIFLKSRACEGLGRSSLESRQCRLPLHPHRSPTLILSSATWPLRPSRPSAPGRSLVLICVAARAAALEMLDASGCSARAHPLLSRWSSRPMPSAAATSGRSRSSVWPQSCCLMHLIAPPMLIRYLVAGAATPMSSAAAASGRSRSSSWPRELVLDTPRCSARACPLLGRRSSSARADHRRRNLAAPPASASPQRRRKTHSSPLRVIWREGKRISA